MTTNDLSSFIEDITGESYLRVQENLGDGFVRLRAREAQRRQAKQDITCFEDVVLELLRNARDAGARAIFIASWKEQGTRYLTALDDGDGIPEHLHETIFEPFVTSKLDTFHEDRWGVHGRGMALYSIKENVDSACVQYSKRGAGTALAVHALTSNLTERIDQSTVPYVHVNDLNEQIMRGPRNIARIVMEFALDSKDTLDIFLGSPVEIAATLLHYRQDDGGSSLTSDPDTILNYLKYIYDPEQFSERAAEIGLPLSSRSARRILDGQIDPLAPFIERLDFEREGRISKPFDPQGNGERTASDPSSKLYHEQRKLKIAPDDLTHFKQALENAFAELAEHYYLEREGELKIRAGSDKITVSIPFRMQH
jgi:hypothetical protein